MSRKLPSSNELTCPIILDFYKKKRSQQIDQNQQKKSGNYRIRPKYRVMETHIKATIKMTKTYSGSVGISCVSAFNPT